MHVMMRLPSTRKREYVNLSPSNGSTMIRSWRERERERERGESRQRGGWGHRWPRERGDGKNVDFQTSLYS
jgi:hypothetical protein